MIRTVSLLSIRWYSRLVSTMSPRATPSITLTKLGRQTQNFAAGLLIPSSAISTTTLIVWDTHILVIEASLRFSRFLFLFPHSENQSFRLLFFDPPPPRSHRFFSRSVTLRLSHPPSKKHTCHHTHPTRQCSSGCKEAFLP